MSRLPTLILVVSSIAAVACGDDDVPGAADAAAVDAASPDAAPPDAARPDAAFTDAGADVCAADVACPAPSGARVSLCGRLFDVETGAPVVAAAPSDNACDPDAPAADGPCAVSIEFYDPLAFAADPVGTAPLNIDELFVDNCGRFRASNVVRPFNGFIATVVRDNASGEPVYAGTAEARAVAANERVPDVRAPAARLSTVAAWTTSAGEPFGEDTFADVGAILMQFTYQGEPVAKVTAEPGSGSSTVHYFDDAEPSRLSSVGDGATTGANGAALVVDAPLSQHSGSGAEPAGCEWESALGASIAGFVLYAPRRAVAEGTGEPCP